MKPENFGDVLERHIDDVVDVLFNVFVVGKRVALVKLESRLQQRVATIVGFLRAVLTIENN